MSKIERTSGGIVEFMFENIETVSESPDLTIKDKVDMYNKMFKIVLGTASLEMQNKRLALRAPGIAADKSIVLHLGAGRKE